MKEAPNKPELSAEDRQWINDFMSDPTKWSPPYDRKTEVFRMAEAATLRMKAKLSEVEKQRDEFQRERDEYKGWLQSTTESAKRRGEQRDELKARIEALLDNHGITKAKINQIAAEKQVLNYRKALEAIMDAHDGYAMKDMAKSALNPTTNER
jgi:chromosome segregation ATPase